MLIIVKQLFLILYDFCSSVFQLTVATSNWNKTQRENIYVLMQNNRFEVKMRCYTLMFGKNISTMCPSLCVFIYMPNLYI